MKRIVESMRRVLLRRIVENLDEADVYADRGNARFTPSGYTDEIEGEGDFVVTQDEFEKDYEVK